MATDQCPKCRAYLWPWKKEPHHCPPTWEVWCEDWHGDRAGAETIYAADAESAAEKWAAESDADGDYTIIRGNEIMVHAAAPGSSEVYRFEVHGEMVPEYHADPLT